MPHVMIVGAGPAGSLAAALLARAGARAGGGGGGWRATLVEQHRFPREKVCGECLSALGIDVLRRNRLLDAVGRLGPALLRRAIVHDQTGRSTQMALSSPMWGISRAAMDDALLEQARASGANIFQPARCEAIEPKTIVRDLRSNRLVEMECDWLLLADGKAALSSPRPPATKDLGVRAHFANADAPRDAIQLFGATGHYGGTAPIENGLFNVAFSVPAARVADGRGDLRKVFDDVLAENPAMRRQFRAATMVGQPLASPLPRYGVGREWPKQVIPIGNAAAAVEPIGGEGMGLALRSAELAAQELIEAHARSRPPDLAKLRREYEHLWNVRSIVCRLGAKLISSPMLAPAARELFEANPALSRFLLTLAGKQSATDRGAAGQTL